MSTLEQFEALVLSQQPASQPWAPVTDYSFEARKEAEGIHPQLIVDVLQPESVLDVGCGPGHLMRLLSERGVPCSGLDVALMTTSDERMDHWDVTMPHEAGETWIPTRWVSDVVICREVLEHLTVKGIRRAVENLCLLSSRLVYLTTRFNPSPVSIWDVQTSDDLDPTHISMLPQDLLRTLFVLEGFKRRADLEARMDWKGYGRVLVYERAA